MRRKAICLMLAGALAAVLAGGGRALAGTGAPPAKALLTGAPVVIELYTSQGCSSCPPAERLLSVLGRRMRGRVIPLAFHVDYWNHGGWRDPFSSPRWSARQMAYDRILGLRDVYTPQMVVDGTSQCIGSDRAAVMRLIEQADDPAGTVQIAAAPVERGSHELRVEVAARLAQALVREQEVMLAVYENGLVTPVNAGENSGATLRDNFVVRSFVRAFTLKGAAGSAQHRDLTVRLDPSWKVAELGVAAFIQDPVTMAINGAASAPVTFSSAGGSTDVR